MKRFLSILISMVIMSAMVLPVGVFAEGEETANPVLTIPVTQDQSVISNKNDSTVEANPYTVKNLLVANTASAQRRHALMEFNCSANAEQLTAIKDATKIELVLTFTGAIGTNSLLLYNIPDAYDDTWEEDTVTWNSVTNILTSGEELAKIENAKINTLTSGDLLEIDVTDYVKNDANGILGFRFYTDVNKDITFASKENTEYTGPVLKVYLPSEALKAEVNEAMEALTLELANADAVTENFNLPTAGENETAISWESSDESVVSISDGVAAVTRPDYSAADKRVTLTATITKAGYSVEKAFDLIVKKDTTGYVQGEAVTINAFEDTVVYPNEPDKNNGSAENLVGDARTKYKRISFIRFNSFDGLDVVSKKIELKLYVTGTEIKDDTQPVKMKVYGITDDKTTWKENELTYNTATSLITEGTEIATIEVAGRNEYTIDVTDYVRSQSDGAYVFRLKSEANVFVVGSSESDNPPVLYIAEPENEIWFADADGYTNKISNGSLTAKITKTDGADGVLLVALYENVNGSLKLLNVITDNEATVDGDNKVYEQAITVSDSAKQVVKAFFVDSMQNIIPLVAAKELK